MDWKLKTYDGVVYDGKLWFSNNSFNGLFNLELLTGQIRLVDFFPNENSMILRCHKKCLLIDGKLFFIPACGHNIHIYDVSKRSFIIVPVDNNGEEFCSDIVFYNGAIYFFPMYKNQELLRFDVDTYEIKEISSFKRAYSSMNDCLDDLILCRISQAENRVSFSFYNTDIVATFDIITEQFTYFHSGVSNIFASYENDKGIWIFTCNSGCLYLYDFNSPVQLVYEEDKELETPRYNRLFNFAGRIWAIPRNAGTIISIDDGGAIDVSKVIGEDVEGICLYGAAELEDERLLLPFGNIDLMSIDKNGLIKSKFRFSLTDTNDQKRILKNIINSDNRICVESDCLTIVDYLMAVKN